MDRQTSQRPFEPTDTYAGSALVEIAQASGVAKAHLGALQTLTLGILAGAFIAFGAMFYTAVITGSTLGLGPTRLLGGVAFSLGLILAIVGGAELFTGNNLLAIAWAERLVTTRQLLRNWALVYVGNLIGALATAEFVHLAGILDAAALATTAINIAEAKLALGAREAFARGLLCNTLVCLAVWLCFAARSVAGKILAIVPPISAFVALGFEHSIANMYLIPMGWLAGSAAVTWSGFLFNMFWVTLGNIVGGSVLVALVYWVIYRMGPLGAARPPDQ